VESVPHFHFVLASSRRLQATHRSPWAADRQFLLSSFLSHSPSDTVPDLPLLCLLWLPGSLPPRVEHRLRWHWCCSGRGAACAGQLLSLSRTRGLLLHLLAQSTNDGAVAATRVAAEGQLGTLRRRSSGSSAPHGSGSIRARSAPTSPSCLLLFCSCVYSIRFLNAA